MLRDVPNAPRPLRGTSEALGATLWDKLTDMTPPARFDTPDPTLDVLRELGIEHPTLQDWLEFNGVEDDDAELLDVIPPEFADEYIERVRRRRVGAANTAVADAVQ